MHLFTINTNENPKRKYWKFTSLEVNLFQILVLLFDF